MKRQLTASYTPQLNGVVEQRNQTIVGMARSFLKSKGMPGRFWGEAVTTTVYLLNRSTTKSVEKMTPHEAWCGRRPSVHHSRAFGCIVHVKVTNPSLKKLDDRSQPMVFLEYEPGTTAYRVLHPSTNRVHVFRDVVFDEDGSWEAGTGALWPMEGTRHKRWTPSRSSSSTACGPTYATPKTTHRPRPRRLPRLTHPTLEGALRPLPRLTPEGTLRPLPRPTPEGLPLLLSRHRSP